MTGKSPPEIGLVSCVATKRDESATPKDLYTSAYFEKMRSYAERFHDDWWILSAKHGLLDPDGEPIAPYDESLTSATVAEKKDWAQQVHDSLKERGLLDDEVIFVIHAGKDYYKEFRPLLEQHQNASVRLPMEGMMIGERMAWYKERLS